VDVERLKALIWPALAHIWIEILTHDIALLIRFGRRDVGT
jgi:hypothetical protein